MSDSSKSPELNQTVPTFVKRIEELKRQRFPGDKP